MVELLLDGVQGGRFVVVGILVEEGADVHFVDDHLIEGGGGEVVPLPVVGIWIGDDRVADRTRHMTGVGVDAGDHLLAVDEDESVLLANLRPGHLAVPVTIVLTEQLVRGGLHLLYVILAAIGLGSPVVEGAGDGNGLGVWSPHPECGAAIDDGHAHALGALGIVDGNGVVGVHTQTSGGDPRVVGHRSPSHHESITVNST